MGLIVDVTTTEVKITNKDYFTINQGEYNINKCVFSFSAEYYGLVKRVVFQNVLDQKYFVEINENECIIPEIMLRLSGFVYLKVFAYDNNDDGTLNLRYSPTPDTFDVDPGSYTPTDTAILAPEAAIDYLDQIKEFIEYINKQLEEGNFNGVGIKEIVYNLDYTITIVLTNGNRYTSRSIRGAPGPKGDPGEKGDTPKVSFEINKDGYLILTEED